MRTVLRSLLISAGLAACQSSTGPSLAELQQAQAQWASHHLTRYAYRYLVNGGFNAFDGQAIRLVVIDDTVRSAQFVATHDTLTSLAGLPTIDALFALAITGEQEGRLSGAQFDPTFGYPTSLTFHGPPDAGGVVAASDLELLP